ncbi:DUF4912 domain-containing protein [Methylomonas sp. MgM2]
MYGISQAISRDFSPRFFASRATRSPTTQFSPQELLDISRQIIREYAPTRNSGQSRLVLLAISPRRLHAYWRISKRRLSTALNRIEQQPMTLRIYTQPETNAEEVVPGSTPASWLDVDITNDDGHQDIYLSEPVPDSTPFKFRAVIGENRGERTFIPLVYSNTAAPCPSPQARHQQSGPVIQLMMSVNHASSTGKSASGQGKNRNDEYRLS